MNIISHVLLSMLLVLVAYLGIQNQQIRAELNALNASQQSAANVLTETLAPLSTKIDAINSVTSKIGKDADDAAKQKLAALQKRLDLYKLVGTLNQANQLRAEGKGAEAAEKLASTKKPIWEAGEIFTAHKAKLQGLMGPIDKLTGAWKSGDTSANVDAVRKELEAVLGALGNEQQ